MKKDDKKAASKQTTGPMAPKTIEAGIATAPETTDWRQATVGRFYGTGKQRVIQLSERAEDEFANIFRARMEAAATAAIARMVPPGRLSKGRLGEDRLGQGGLDQDRLKQEKKRFKIFFLHLEGLSAREIAESPMVSMSVQEVERILLEFTRSKKPV